MHPTAAAVASLIWPSGNHRRFEPLGEHPLSLWECSIYPLNSPTRFREDPVLVVPWALHKMRRRSRRFHTVTIGTNLR